MRTLPTLVFALAAPLLFAQTADNYIEVSVTDTTAPVLERIMYSVDLLDQIEAYPDYTEEVVAEPMEAGGKVSKKDKEEAEAAEAARKLEASVAEARRQASMVQDVEQLKADLRNNGFTLSRILDEQPNYDVYPGNEEHTSPGAAVELHSLAELDRLVAWVKTKNNLHGNVMQWKYASDQGTKSMKGMYAQARDQANGLATAAGRKLGRMISAREPDRSEIVQMMDAVMRKEMHNDPGFLQPRQRTMIFRFALVD